MNLNTCNFIKRIEQVLAELDISAIEEYVIIIIIINQKAATNQHSRHNHEVHHMASSKNETVVLRIIYKKHIKIFQ